MRRKVKFCQESEQFVKNLWSVNLTDLERSDLQH